MIVLRWLWAQVEARPVRAAALVRSVIVLGTAFGLNLTVVQVTAIYTITEAFLMFVTEDAVTPTTTADAQIKAALYTPVPALPPQ